MNLRLIAGLLIIGFALFKGGIDLPIIDNTPVVVDVVPSDELQNKVMPVASLVTNKDDKLKMSVFFKEFSDRVINYEDVKLQQVQDILVEAAVIYFDPPLVKYEGFSDGLSVLIRDAAGDDDVYLSTEVKKDLSSTMEALAWALNQ